MQVSQVACTISERESLKLTCVQVNSSQSTSFCDAIPVCRSSAYRIDPVEMPMSWAIAERQVDLAAPLRPSKQKISPYRL